MSSEEPNEKLLTALRDAIVAKLEELGAPKNACDHATCDYIILIAANKSKTKEEIAEQLRFILEDKSEEFVDWYLPICTKLKTKKVDKKGKSKKSKKSRKQSSKSESSASSLLTKLTNDLTKNYLPKPGTSETIDELNEQIEAIIGDTEAETATVKIEGVVPVKPDKSESSSDEEDADTVSVTVAPQDTLLGSSSGEEEDTVDTSSSDTSQTDSEEQLDMESLKPRIKLRASGGIDPIPSTSTDFSHMQSTSTDFSHMQSTSTDFSHMQSTSTDFSDATNIALEARASGSIDSLPSSTISLEARSSGSIDSLPSSTISLVARASGSIESMPGDSIDMGTSLRPRIKPRASESFDSLPSTSSEYSYTPSRASESMEELMPTTSSDNVKYRVRASTRMELRRLLLTTNVDDTSSDDDSYVPSRTSESTESMPSSCISDSSNTSSKDTNAEDLGRNTSPEEQLDSERTSKRQHAQDPPLQPKRRKLVSTVRVECPEPEAPVRTVIPSVISQPSAQKKRCDSLWDVNRKKILMKAMREANQSTATAIRRVSPCRASPDTSSDEEDEDLQVEVKNVGEEEEEQREGEEDSGEGEEDRGGGEEQEEEEEERVGDDEGLGSDERMSYSTIEDRDFTYRPNTGLEYDIPSLPFHEEAPQASTSRDPTFIVTMNKTKEEYLPARQTVKRRRLGNRGDSEEEEGEQDQETPYRTDVKSESSEEDLRREYKRFKHKRKMIPSSVGSASEDDDGCTWSSQSSLSPRLSLSQLKIEDSNEPRMNTPPPYNLDVPSTSQVPNTAEVPNYYSSMERWISGANYPPSFDELPPPMPSPVLVPPMFPLTGPPPPMPPGFLPPPPSGYPPPMPPGFLPPPPPMETPMEIDQPQESSSYEINVRVPCQDNDNLITVKCQKLDSPSSSSQVSCKFYPNCTKVNCPYFHPSMCTNFPSCRFGKECAFTHPPCKFGSVCNNPNCKYSHTSTKATAALSSVKSVAKTKTASNSTSSICKFHPSCFNAVCPYFHPKVCMYASNCKNAGCVFFHPNEVLTALNNKTGTLTAGSFKWKANTGK